VRGEKTLWNWRKSRLNSQTNEFLRELIKQRKYLEVSEQSILADLRGKHLYYYIISIISITTLKYFGF